jgi:hypothetical protein
MKEMVVAFFVVLVVTSGFKLPQAGGDAQQTPPELSANQPDQMRTLQ